MTRFVVAALALVLAGCSCEPGPVVERLGNIQSVEYKITEDEESMYVTAAGTRFFIQDNALPGASEGNEVVMRKLKSCPSRSFTLCTDRGCAKIWTSKPTRSDSISTQDLNVRR